MQQPNAGRLLKVLNLAGDYRRREIHLSGGCGKAALIHHAMSDTHD
jgi:hypothetical protein